jgi:hypothetical protein
MTDTPQHIREMQLKLWMSKTPEERLYQFIIDNDAMYQALRDFKIKNGLPLDGLDPIAEVSKKKDLVKARKSSN